MRYFRPIIGDLPFRKYLLKGFFPALCHAPNAYSYMGAITFFTEGLKNLKTVGTVTRSSKFLCKEAVSYVDFSQAKVVVGLGAGDGVITKHILRQLRPDAKVLAFEVLPNMAAKMRELQDDRLIVVEGSAENIGKHLAAHGLDKADFVVSAIPFAALPNELGFKIVREAKKHLKENGLYIQVHYSLVRKKMYEEVFGNVDYSFVPLNLPPAFVLVSEKTEA